MKASRFSIALLCAAMLPVAWLQGGLDSALLLARGGEGLTNGDLLGSRPLAGFALVSTAAATGSVSHSLHSSLPSLQRLQPRVSAATLWGFVGHLTHGRSAPPCILAVSMRSAHEREWILTNETYEETLVA